MTKTQKSFSKVGLLALLASLLFTSQISLAQNRCFEIFKDRSHAPESVFYYLDVVEKANATPRDPRFIDPKEEVMLAATWGGTKDVPTMIRRTLHERTSVIDYQLLAADKGTVKVAGAGNFMSLRLNHTWRGKDMSTNLGTTADALIASALNKSSYMVPKNAKGVIFFLHGGGTKTTGHHVAANLTNFMNQFGVVVIAIDAPYHAYGPRATDLAPREYYEYLRDLRNELVPEEVPTFVGGHSMGGLHADNIMRLSADSSFGFQKAFKGLISLSPPVDNAPGKSLKAKSLAEELILRDETVRAKILESEVDLNVALLKEGKTSALSGVSTESFMALVNWTKPADNGASMIPSLYVMGAKDALYVGREKIFDEYVTELSNTDVVIIGPRPTFKSVRDNSKYEDIGHMIFDHYRPGTEVVREGQKKAHPEPETFNLIKEYIEAQTGQTLARSFRYDAKGNQQTNSNPLLTDYAGSSIGLIQRIVQEYYNNLAFRTFTERYSFLVRVAKPEQQQLGQEKGQLQKEFKELTSEIKALRKNDPEGRLAAKEERLTQVQARTQEILAKSKSNWIPEGELQSFAEANVGRRKEIAQEVRVLNDSKKVLVKELTQVRQRRDQLQSKHERTINHKMDELSESHPEVAVAFKVYEQAAERMVEMQEKMNEMNSEMVHRMIEEHNYIIDPSPAHIDVYRQLDKAFAEFNVAERAWRGEIEKAIGRGELGKEEAEVFIELYGNIEAFALGKPAKDSLIEKTESLKDEIEALEIQMSKLQVEENSLLVAYIKKVTPELFDIEMTTMAKEMNRPLEDVLEHPGRLENAWGTWTKIWKERPPEQATSLY